MAFTHLHVHTEFSLLDGSSKIREIAVQAKKLGYDSLAITDHGVMYGVIDFTALAVMQESSRYWDVRSMCARDPASTRKRTG